MSGLLGWWVDLLLHHGLIGPVVAVVLAAFVMLAVGCAVAWALVGVKWGVRQATAGFRRGRPV